MPTSEINEEILRERLTKSRYSRTLPQLLVAIAVCLGAFSFGNIIGWGGPALYQLKEFKYDEAHAEYYYNWAISLGPLAAALGIFPWSCLMGYVGPKSIMLFQAPFLLASWFFVAYYDTYKIYCTAHFFTAFFAVCYIHAGQTFLIETIYKTYLKDIYVYFRCSPLLGILFMNIISPLFSKWNLCIICASIPVLCSIILIFIPESPVFLLQKQDVVAEKALKFYRGNRSIIVELNIMRQYMLFLNYGFNSGQILSATVVRKTMLIVAILNIIKIMTGYYVFLLDSVRIFTRSRSLIYPYVDNLVFSAAAVAFCIIGTAVHIRMLLGVKKPMMVSGAVMAVILFVIGTVCFIDRQLDFNNQKCLILSTLCLFLAAYEAGMDIGPDIILFHYCPYQVYDYVMCLMAMLQWLLVFGMQWLFMLIKSNLGLAVMLWIYAVIATFGVVFVKIWVIEPRGKTLMRIQLELGGNPIGQRGSRRRRIPHPLEDFELEEYAQRLLRLAQNM